MQLATVLVRPWAAGLGLAIVAGLAAIAVAEPVPSLSPALVAIATGVIVGNVVAMPAIFAPGLAIAGRRILRIGIVLLGLQLVLGDIAKLGWPVLLVIVALVVGGIAVTMLLGRLLGLTVDQSLLIACGCSICGAAAIAAVEGALQSRRIKEAATAIALIVIFGTAMILLLPAVAALASLGVRGSGIWAGASIHEVAQVVAAGAVIGPAALKLAVVVKLARVLALAPVVTVVSWWQRLAVTAATDAVASDAEATGKKAQRPPIMPLFVVGFLAMVALRSSGIVPTDVLTVARFIQTLALAAAMFALGCSVHWTVVRDAGGRVFTLAAAATLVVTTLGLGAALVA